MIFFSQIFTLPFLCNYIYVFIQQCPSATFFPAIMSLQTVLILLVEELNKPSFVLILMLICMTY